MQRFIVLYGIISLACFLQGCTEAPKEPFMPPRQDIEEAKKLLVGKWEEVEVREPHFPRGFEFKDSGKALYLTRLSRDGAEDRDGKPSTLTGTYEVGLNTLKVDLKTEDGSESHLYWFTVSQNELLFYKSGPNRAEVVGRCKRVKEFSKEFVGKN